MDRVASNKVPGFLVTEFRIKGCFLCALLTCFIQAFSIALSRLLEGSYIFMAHPISRIGKRHPTLNQTSNTSFARI
ncbi:hypothetical protein SY26_06905 [Paracoccus sp. 228]|nr:hypothetical protein SY26_06905 [Paracoccus sp. 228]